MHLFFDNKVPGTFCFVFLFFFFFMGGGGVWAWKLNDPDANGLKLRKKTFLLFGGGIQKHYLLSLKIKSLKYFIS